MDSLFFHPKLVHLPLALALLMPLVSAGLLLAWIRGLLPRRTWVVAFALQAVLVGSAVLAMRSGENEEERVESVVAESRIEEHEELAEQFTWAAAATLMLFGAVFLLRNERAAKQTGGAAVVASLVVLALAIQAGQAGGELVYKHGAAAAYTSGPAAPGLQQPQHDDD